MIRFLDLTISIFFILLLLPFFFLISLLLFFSGEGEIFFLQERIGIKHKKFKLIKFATMLKDSPNLGTKTITVKNDPRVLPFGKFLRKTKINEFPQLFNILLGHMSFVGPRPLTEETFNIYSDEVKKILFKLKPGLTGIGSIFFRNEEKIICSSYKGYNLYKDIIAPYKGKLEIWYYKNISIRTYFMTFLITIYVVFFDDIKIIFRFYDDLPAPSSTLKKIMNL